MHRCNAFTSLRSRHALSRLSNSLAKRNHQRSVAASSLANVIPRRATAQRALSSLRELLATHKKPSVPVVNQAAQASPLSPAQALFYREVQARLPGRISELELSQASDGVYVLDGCCPCYYVKQWIQHLAMELFGSQRLLNRMRVLPPR